MLTIAGQQLASHLLLGTAGYPTLETMQQAVRASRTELITAAIRRQRPTDNAGANFWDIIKNLGCRVLPNTAGCYTAKEAILTSQMAREIFQTNWIKLEIIGDEYSLHPDPFELVIAAKELVLQGFEVFPYCTDDLVLCQRLVDSGCHVLMPLAAPIGSGQGLLNPQGLQILRKQFPDIVLIIDAGIGKPSHAVQAMEFGYDGVLLNSAIALAQDPVDMAIAFSHGVIAGRMAHAAGLMPTRNCANPSTPVINKPFWQHATEN